MYLHRYPDQYAKSMELVAAVIRLQYRMLTDSETSFPHWEAFTKTYLPCLFADSALELLETGLHSDEPKVKPSFYLITVDTYLCLFAGRLFWANVRHIDSPPPGVSNGSLEAWLPGIDCTSSRQSIVYLRETRDRHYRALWRNRETLSQKTSTDSGDQQPRPLIVVIVNVALALYSVCQEPSQESVWPTQLLRKSLD